METYIILGLIIFYVTSALLLEAEFVFEFGIDTLGGCLIILCPILNTIMLIKCYCKKFPVKKITKEVVEVFNKIKKE